MLRCETLCLFLTSSYVYFSIMQNRGVGRESTKAINLPLPHIQGLICAQTAYDPGLYLDFQQYSGFEATYF